MSTSAPLAVAICKAHLAKQLLSVCARALWCVHDRVRFHRPYIHTITALNGGDGSTMLTVGQAKFEAEGFASTVWDSCIVLAKYFERWRRQYAGKRCLDLSAGCGLVGAALCACSLRQI